MIAFERLDFLSKTTFNSRTITVKDAMSDLPPIKNGATKHLLTYGSEAQSHFQRSMRSREIAANLKELAAATCHGDEIELKAKQASKMALRDHVCKNLAPLIEMRMVSPKIVAHPIKLLMTGNSKA